MMKTVTATAMARKMASEWWPSRWRKASSGPYAEEDRPSAPRPTQAKKAISEMCRKRFGFRRSRGRPSRRFQSDMKGEAEVSPPGTAIGTKFQTFPGWPGNPVAREAQAAHGDWSPGESAKKPVHGAPPGLSL